MDTITAFISHRSTDKILAKRIIEIVKRDNCILDEFDFYPGERTMDEIIRNLNRAPIFVLLVSRAALESDWVKREMELSRSLYSEGKIKNLLPFIIEADIELSDLPNWMTRDWAFNIKYISSPRIIAQFIIEAQRRLRCVGNHEYNTLVNTFIGRSAELDEFQKSMFDSVEMSHRALVVSGKPGSGRTRFIQKIIQDSESLQFVPEGFQIKLPQKSYVDHFLLQLHEGLGYTSDSYQDIIRTSHERQIAKAVEYINEIINAHSFLVIEDEMSFILYDGSVAEWAKEILTHKTLIDSLKIFISSRVRPRVSEIRRYPQIIHINLQGFTKEERRRLFINYCRYHKVNLSSEDIEFFISELQSSPQQLETAVQYIKERNVQYAKRHIKDLISIGDEVFSRVISNFKGDDTALTLARVLAEVDMISFDLIEELYEEDYEKIEELIFQFEALSILDFYGPGGSYISLDGGVADYIRRSKIELDRIMEARIKEVVYDKIDTLQNVDQSDELSELSVYLYGLSKQLLTGKGIAFIMPSMVISTVIRLYDKGDYTEVKKICLHALEKSSLYSKEPLQELYYRLCQVLARMKDNEFFNYIKYIDDKDSQNFLLGFYYRYKEDYPQAEKFLKKVLDVNPNMQVARRELVNVFLNQSKYGTALPWAKENYERKKTNSYHIEAYFRCLVSQFPWDEDVESTLKQLIHEMQDNFSKRKDELLEAMQLEYDMKSRKFSIEEIDKKLSAALDFYPHSPQLQRIKNEYQQEKKRYTVSMLGHKT